MYSCKCLQSLLKGGKNRKINIWNQKVQDIVVKKWGVHALKSCVLDELIDIRITGLDILSHLCHNRSDASKIVVEIGILDTCLDFI